MKGYVVLVCVTLGLAGCDWTQEANLGEEGAEGAVQTGDWAPDPRILPAHQLPWEKKGAAKTDWATNYHKAHPQWYTITQPPSVAFRPMKEWEPMQALIIAYSDYVPSASDVREPLLDIGAASLEQGELWVVYSDAAARTDLSQRLAARGVPTAVIQDQVRWFQFDNDAIWVMDFGPLSLVSQENPTVAFADFRYYYDRYHDDAVPTRMANAVGVTAYRSPLDYEGGNFQADGEEFCYFSERVYSNTGLSFEAVQKVQQDYYGCKTSVVLKDITNDGTGHIDMFFKLCSKHVAVLGAYTVVSDNDNKERMAHNAAILQSLGYADGSGGITVYRMPFPNPGKWGSGPFTEKIPRTYINSTFYLSPDGSKGLNLWPVYSVDQALQAEALAVWQQAMPDWEHRGILSDELSLYSGAIHCVSRTVPAFPLTKWVGDGTCVAGACQGGEFDGPCLGEPAGADGCWGPAWACLCDDCDDPGCAFPETCGNGLCDGGESCLSCAADCPCGGGQRCDLAKKFCVSGICGDGHCEGGETCSSCAADCGCQGGNKCSMGVCTSSPCGGITYDGCCDGSLSVYCDNNLLVATDCGSAGCGWNGSQGYYDCEYSGSDPSMSLPRDCRGNYDYPIGCGERECGDNGGGYSCGQCPVGDECSPEGQCIAGCRPFCGDRVCGDDGCGGVCGLCGELAECVDGACVPVCVPDCGQRKCGDDGCGGFCGTCEEGASCQAGVCEPDAVCVPDCEDRWCGEDGCGGSCGSCDTGLVCAEGQCISDGRDGDPVDSDPVDSDPSDGGIGGGSDSCSSSGAGTSGSPVPLFLVVGVLACLWVRRRPFVIEAKVLHRR
jgi:agmatine/peptidylarginine deiminase